MDGTSLDPVVIRTFNVEVVGRQGFSYSSCAIVRYKHLRFVMNELGAYELNQCCNLPYRTGRDELLSCTGCGSIPIGGIAVAYAGARESSLLWLEDYLGAHGWNALDAAFQAHSLWEEFQVVWRESVGSKA